MHITDDCTADGQYDQHYVDNSNYVVDVQPQTYYVV